MSNRRFGPTSKGPRKLPSVAAYGLVEESLNKCSRTGRIRRQAELVGTGDELRIEYLRNFRQSAISGDIKTRVEGVRKFYDSTGKVIAKLPYRAFEIDACRDDGRDKPQRQTAAVKAHKCTCKVIAGRKYDRRHCRLHTTQAISTQRYVCRCGISFVPQERFQDCCKACWTIGETKSARVFGQFPEKDEP